MIHRTKISAKDIKPRDIIETNVASHAHLVGGIIIFILSTEQLNYKTGLDYEDRRIELISIMGIYRDLGKYTWRFSTDPIRQRCFFRLT